MFNEANTVEDYIRDLLTTTRWQSIHDARTTYIGDSAATAAELGWKYVANTTLPRTTADVLVEEYLRVALVRLNPEIAAQPDRADEVLYRLRALLISVRTDGLVKANEEFTSWLRGERTMPFGPNNQHTTVRLIDFDDTQRNDFIVTTQLTYKAVNERRFDLVLFINGIPVVVCEAKTPVRPAISWIDGAIQIHDDYEVNVPAFFVPNVFSFATEGKTFRFGAIRMPLQLWAPWRAGDHEAVDYAGLAEVRTAVRGLLHPPVVLNIMQSFTLFATDKQYRKIKLICRYQQYHATNQIVERVVEGRIKKGLIWHFQGSGKSLLMVFAAQKLRFHPALKNPTVVIVVDRIDLDTQITGTFNATDVPNLVAATTRQHLQSLLAQDARKVIITTIYRFAEAPGVLNARSNIILLVDEAHRTQEGDLGRQMREALPNAFLFGLTGTPINKRDHNTFWAFGAEEDEQGYLSRYGFEESIRDNATLPLHFEPRLVELHIDKQAIDAAYAAMTDNLNDADRANLAKQAARMAVLVKAPERVQAIVADIVAHYRATIEPNEFKAQLVAYDREACVLYKQALDTLLPPEASDIVMSVTQGETEWKQYDRGRGAEEKLLDRFRDRADPLKILIVTARLLTGFDAPILQVMYLDKPLKEHTLLQAICRTNRPYPNKSHGLIVDYLGVFDDVAKALAFDEATIKRAVSNLEALKMQVATAIQQCLSYFTGLDRMVVGYEGLLAAQDRLPTNEVRDAFAADYSKLARLWEALSPDPILQQFRDDYRWLSQVYESVRPPSGNGRLLWHALGAKTIALIHEHIHVEAVHDDLETLIMDADVLEGLFDDPQRSSKEVEFKIVERLRRHKNDPVFIALGERLEELKDRQERGLLASIDFLKRLLEIARDILAEEKKVDPVEEQDKGKAALTDLFNSVRSPTTPIIVKRIVNEIDEIVRLVRFPGWQHTKGGEREVKQALRRGLRKFDLHQQGDLFDRAYAYVAEYY